MEDENGDYIYIKDGQHQIKLSSHDRLRYIVPTTYKGRVNLVRTPTNDFKIWHKRMGCLNYPDLKHLLESNGDLRLKPSDRHFCETCALAKIHKRVDKKLSNQTIARMPGEVVHTDIWGPIKIKGTGGKRYVIIFVDVATRIQAVYFMQHKNEALTMWKRFVNEWLVKLRHFARMTHPTLPRVTLQWQQPQSKLRSDNDSVYKDTKFKKYCDDQHITQEFSPPYHQSENGLAERQ